jgi:hypothetical protein
MTNPSVEERKKQAALALKRKLVESLVKTSNKTDKVQKLLRESPEYKEYLAQSALSHLEAFKEVGLEETSDRRKIAEKSSLLEAQRLMDDDPLGALKQEVNTSLEALSHMTAGLSDQVVKAEKMLAAVEEGQQLEFISSALSGKAMSIFIDKSAVKVSKAGLASRQKEQAELEKLLTKSLGATSKTVVRDALREFNSKFQTARESIRKNSRDLSDVFDTMVFTVNDQALSALIAQKIKKGELDSLAEARTWLDRFLSIAGSLMEKNTVTGTVSRALKLITATGQAVVRNKIIDDGSDEYSKTHTRNEVYAEHTDNPLMMATNLVEKQKIALDIFMKSFDTTLSGAMIATMGPGEIVMQAWAPISVAITQVVTSRLDARILGAKKLIAESNAAKALELETDEGKELEGEIKEGIADVLLDQAGTFAKSLLDQAGNAPEEKGLLNTGIGLLDEITSDPGDFVATVLGWIMPPLMRKVWEIWPPKPAQQISGADLERVQNVLFEAQIPSFASNPNARGPQTGNVVELGGRPDDVAESIWNKFTATNAQRTESPNDPANRTYRVSTLVPEFGDVDVWGSFDPRTSLFTPDQLTAAALDDWSGRTIAGAGYTDGVLSNAGPDVKGTWQLVTVGTWRYVVLAEGNGTLHWGGYAANTKGPRGVSSTLAAIVNPLSPVTRTMAAFTIAG